MTKPLSLVLLFLCSLTCLHAQEFFEGEVQYTISYEAINKNLSANILERELGSTMTAYVKEDRYTMITHISGQQGWIKVIIRLDEGFSYTEYEKSDTIIKSKLNKPPGTLINLSSITENKKMVLGEACEAISLHYTPAEHIPFVKEIKGTYYFNPKYRLNAKWYTEQTEGFWNLYVQESKSLSLRNEVEYSPLFKSIQEATSVAEKDMDHQLFEPNADKIISME